MKKVVLITGANSDIGLKIVENLIKTDCYYLILQARDVLKLRNLIEANYGKVSFIKSELSNHYDIDRLWTEALIVHNKVDGIIYCAGYSEHLNKCANEKYWDMWQKAMTINSVAPAYLSKLASEHFVEQDFFGKIIMISSRAAHQGDDSNKTHYAASKAAMSNITKSLAKNSQDFHAYAYNVAPAFVKTERIKNTVLKNKDEKWISDNFPLNSLVEPYEVADVVEFLLTKENKQLTGSTIHVNGGTCLV